MRYTKNIKVDNVDTEIEFLNRGGELWIKLADVEKLAPVKVKEKEISITTKEKVNG